MANKQTAVDFLYEFVLLKLSNEEQMQFEGLFQQAKQMHKEQIMKAIEMYYPHSGRTRASEKYYNETYENN